MNNRNGSRELVWQQGDVQLFQEPIPISAKPIDSNVLQHGELTGHAHRLDVGNWELRETKEGVKFLHVIEPVALRHEEHDMKVIPHGEYRIGIVQQWNYDEQESQRVVD